MSDQGKFEQADKSQDRYISRRERREERRAARQAGGVGWFAGLILIAIGIVYLLYDAGYVPVLTNWWALFMLLPGVGVLSAAIGEYRKNGGHLTAEVLGLFAGSLLFFGITAVFLFNLNFGWLMPLVLIAAGLFLLFIPRLMKNP